VSWRLVYDIRGAQAADFTPFIYAGLAILALALVFHLWARRKGARSGTARILAGLAFVVGGLGYGVNRWDQDRLATRLEEGSVLRVEGPASGHQLWREDVTDIRRDIGRRYNHWETVMVGGVRFTWAPGAQEPAFTNALTPPLDFPDGTPLRITYVEDVADEAHQRRILRLEAGDAPAEARPPTEAGLPGAPFPSVAPGGQLPPTLPQAKP
jgi:hypothetical protein